jgi:hypothetical protein
MGRAVVRKEVERVGEKSRKPTPTGSGIGFEGEEGEGEGEVEGDGAGRELERMVRAVLSSWESAFRWEEEGEKSKPPGITPVSV